LLSNQKAAREYLAAFFFLRLQGSYEDFRVFAGAELDFRVDVFAVRAGVGFFALGALTVFVATFVAFFAALSGTLAGALARVAATAAFSSALRSATLIVVADLRRRSRP